MTDNFDIIKDFLTPKEIIVEEVNPNPVSYTHLTLPTSNGV